jgi:Holliday junction resolvase RusA-like endonuclease
MRKEDRLYEAEFGEIPNSQEDRLKYILGKRVDNEKFNNMIMVEAKRIQKIKYNKISFTMWKIVKPSARPRVTRNQGFMRMYVPHAAENGDWFKEFARENELPYIETPCILNMKIYEKTPSSFSIKNKILAELGLLRPWKRTGDFDNYAKGIADAIQHGMLKDDCLVIESTQKLYYSIKPHAEIEILYMKEFPEISEEKIRLVIKNKGV